MEVVSTGPEGDIWNRILGTNRVLVTDQPNAVTDPATGKTTLVFYADLDHLNPPQTQLLIRHLAQTTGKPSADIATELPQLGMGVRAENCVTDAIPLSTVEHIRGLPRTGVELDQVKEMFWVSRILLGLFLGEGWVDRHIGSFLQVHDGKKNYFFPRITNEDKNYLLQQRIADLADSLFALQHCKGFDEKLLELRALAKAAPLEDKCVELSLAKMLHMSGAKVNFVPRSGQKGRDYDLEVKSILGHPFAVELKCKRDDTLYTGKGFHRTLKKAVKQISAKLPRVIIVRVPASWTLGGRLSQDCVNTVDQFMASSQKVSAVVLVWERIVPVLPTGRAFVINTLVKQNPVSLWKPPYLSELFQPRLAGLRGLQGRIQFSFGTF